MPFAEQMAAAIADGYRDASLAGAGMRAVAEGFESIRAAFGEADDPYRAWNEVDDSLARAFALPHLPIFLRFRELFAKTVISELLHRTRRALAADSESGSREYVKTYARAVGSWRRDVRDTLAKEEFVPHETLAPVVLAIRSQGQFITEERWVDAYPLFLTLADQDFVTPQDRARLYSIAAEIEVYHIKADTNPDLLLEKARGLAPDEPMVETVRGESRLQKSDVDGARRCAEMALQSDPAFVNALVLLSDCAERGKDFEVAEKWCREAIRLHPGDPQGYRQLVELAGRSPSHTLLEEIPDLVARSRNAEPTSERQILFSAGYAFQLQSEFDKALAYFREARERFPNSDESYTAEAYLLLDQRRRAEAEQVLVQAAAKFPDRPEVYRGRAIIAETGNDWAPAERHYRAMLAQSTRPSALDCAKPAQMVWKQGRREEGETELISVLKQSPDDDSVLQIAERLIDSLVDQDEAPAAVSLCERIFAALGETKRPWYKNKLGDIHFARGEYLDAVERYAEACKLAPEHPLFALDLARALGKARLWDRSRGLWEAAPPSVQADTAFSREIVLLRNDEANSLFSAGKYAKAIPLYQEAIERGPSDAVLWGNLADAWERDADVPVLSRIENAAAAVRRANELDPANKEYRNRIRRLERLRINVQNYGDRIINLHPAVTPIALEVAADLVPLVEGESVALSEEAGRLFVQLREDLLATYGVQVPGVRVRGNEGDLPPGSYIMMLMEIPVLMGTITHDKRLASASVEELKMLGISAEPATDPENGSEKSWVAKADWPAVQQAGIELWSVIEYPVRHLQGLLQHNLADFVGHQETYNLLERQGEDLTRRITFHPGGLCALAGVLRALLEEQVPITAIGPICSRVAELVEAGASRLEIAEKVRSLPELRALLPGNRPDTRLYQAGADLSEALRDAVYEDGGQAVLAVDPTICQEILSAVRAEVGCTRSAIVFDDGRVRPFARFLLELEFPNLAVLSRAEILPDLASRISGEIRLD